MEEGVKRAISDMLSKFPGHKQALTSEDEPPAKRAKFPGDRSQSRDVQASSFATTHENTNETSTGADDNLGRGKRQRKHVNYSMDTYYRNALRPAQSGSFETYSPPDAESQASSQSSNSAPPSEHDSESDEEIDESVADDESQQDENDWRDDASEDSGITSPVNFTTRWPSIPRAAEHEPQGPIERGDNGIPEDAPPSYNEAVRDARFAQHVQRPAMIQSSDTQTTMEDLRRQLDVANTRIEIQTREFAMEEQIRSLQARVSELEGVNNKLNEESEKVRGDLEKYQRIAIAAKKATESNAGANWREFGRRMNELSEAVKDAEEDGLL